MINDLSFPCKSDFLTTNTPLLSIVAICRYLLTSVRFLAFFGGRVPCERWAYTRLSIGLSCWADLQAIGFEKGTCIVPDKTSLTERIVALHTSFKKEQTWQFFQGSYWKNQIKFQDISRIFQDISSHFPGHLRRFAITGFLIRRKKSSPCPPHIFQKNLQQKFSDRWGSSRSPTIFAPNGKPCYCKTP